MLRLETDYSAAQSRRLKHQLSFPRPNAAPAVLVSTRRRISCVPSSLLPRNVLSFDLHSADYFVFCLLFSHEGFLVRLGVTQPAGDGLRHGPRTAERCIGALGDLLPFPYGNEPRRLLARSPSRPCYRWTRQGALRHVRCERGM